MRLVDADDFSRVLHDYFKDCIEHKRNEIDVVDCNADIQHFLEQQPTAYNVDAVVAELASNSRFIDDTNEHNIKCISCVIGQKTAIDIVRKGGVE